MIKEFNYENIIEEYKEFLPKTYLIHSTPIYTSILAIRQCYDSFDNSDSEFTDYKDFHGNNWTLKEIVNHNNYESIELEMLGEKDKKLIKRIIESGHESTIEHINFTFRFEGFSRLMLQELARHRIASYSIMSTRYTLKKLKNEIFEEYLKDGSKYIFYERIAKYVLPPLPYFSDEILFLSFLDRRLVDLKNIQELLKSDFPNDIVKYELPESFRTSGVMTFNARSLRNFLKLRINEKAHFEIRYLAQQIKDLIIDEGYKILVEDI